MPARGRVAYGEVRDPCFATAAGLGVQRLGAALGSLASLSTVPSVRYNGWDVMDCWCESILCLAT